jgi:nitrate reductase / nitrite oxidoreductase, beta subunit
MKVRAQIAMVMNLDKCIGCHTCSVTCKQVWTNKPGVEYVWFNNVESKPGVGYPRAWEDQQRWKGGWVRHQDGAVVPRQGDKTKILLNIFGNPNLPTMEEYYEPFTFDYGHLQAAGECKNPPTARPISLLTGKTMAKIQGGPNWEDDLSGPVASRYQDVNMQGLDTESLARFEASFLVYLPRLCEHCINPTCVASCPEGAIYKREEDGIVLVDQDRCRGWRMCMSGCPYKKIYYNHRTGKAEKCLLCYPRIESGQPTICSETCVGRIRYLGVMLYDADRISAAAAVRDDKELLAAQLALFLDPADPAVVTAARDEGIPQSWLDAAASSPIHELVVKWKLALPLHPEYRTLPMVWYVPPLSPLQCARQAGRAQDEDVLPDIDEVMIPVKFLANLLSAGDEAPVRTSLGRLLALRRWSRARAMQKPVDEAALATAGMTAKDAEDMYKLLAIANYEDRYVLPTSHHEYATDSFGMEGALGRAEAPDCSCCDGPDGLGPGEPPPAFGGFGARREVK